MRNWNWNWCIPGWQGTCILHKEISKNRMSMQKQWIKMFLMRFTYVSLDCSLEKCFARLTAGNSIVKAGSHIAAHEAQAARHVFLVGIILIWAHGELFVAQRCSRTTELAFRWCWRILIRIIIDGRTFVIHLDLWMGKGVSASIDMFHVQRQKKNYVPYLLNSNCWIWNLVQWNCRSMVTDYSM